MTNKKKILIVTQEMKPYVLASTIAKIARELPQYLQEKGKMEIRVLMPRFGTINERRHKLHEVVRLSGINIIIDQDDYPLIIKVASLPGARMQVYFLDNEEFFKRKYIFSDKNDRFYKDNAERMIFFCKGILETVKKFGWPPDVIHCHGWMTSLIPLYIRTAYKNNPIFNNAKLLYSVYENSFDNTLGDIFMKKALIRFVEESDLTPYGAGTNTSLHQGAIHYADAIIKGDSDENLDKEVLSILQEGQDKPVLEYKGEDEYLEAYKEFYSMLLEDEEEEEANS